MPEHESSRDIQQPTRRPFFHARRDGERVRVDGDERAELGHRVARPGRAEPDGVFASWQWDGTRLVARNDRLGFSPLFYWADHDAVGVAPDVLTLLERGAPAALDRRALAAFFRLGFFLGEDTPFAAVRALPPGGTLEWTAGQGARVRSAGYWWGANPPASRDAVVDAYATIFRDAVRRRLPDDPEERVVVPLSGGRDSRHTLLELCAAGRRPALCVTVQHPPPRPDEDARVAAIVARAVGVAHAVVPASRSTFSAERRKNTETGLCADEHGQFVPLVDFLRGRTRTTYDGLGGGTLSAPSFQTPERLRLFAEHRLEELAAKFSAQFCELVETADVAPLLPPELRPVAATSEMAIERIVEELARHERAPNPLVSFFFWNRTRREISLAPLAMLARAVPVVHTPFLDHELYELLSALPPGATLDRTLHTAVIARAHPRFADLPYENPGAAEKEGRATRARYGREAAAFALSRLARRPRTVRASRLFPRAVRTLVDPRYAAASSYLWLPALYLLQLDEATRSALGD